MDKILDLKQIVINTLDINKAQDIVSIDLKDKSSMADFMIIASGTSSRHIQALSEQVLEKLKDNGVNECKIIVFDRHGYKKKSLNSVSYKRLNGKSLKFIEFNKVNISSSQLRKI